jgi:hypothetical protein
MATKKEMIHGFWLEFEEEDRDGMHYLRYDLQREEARTLFEAARLRGSAEFEDDQDRDWSLAYDRAKQVFTLSRRQRE